MSNRITIEYFGVSGTGRTVTEAKRDAGVKLERMAKSYPSVYAYRGASVFIVANSDCWSIRHTWPDSEGQVCSSSSCGGSKDDAIAYGVHNLLTATRHIGEYEVPAWAKHLIDVADTIKGWRGNDAFQLAYKQAVKNNEADPHTWACQHSDQFAA